MENERTSAAWRTLNPDYWRFFTAAFAFDLGTGLFLFLLSLYLVAKGFNEQAIGNFMAALTLGNLAGTLPATILARRHGVRSLLLIGFLCSPLAAAGRIFALHPAWQLALAFVEGATLCAWPICFAPSVAKLTNEENRSAGFSIVFATGIGMGTLAGLVGGWLPGILLAHRLARTSVGAMQWVLLGACAIVLCGVWPIATLKLDEALSAPQRPSRRVHPFLFRFLPPFLLWNVATASFPVFGAIWLHTALRLDLGRVGTVFSASQLMQCMAVLASPLLFRRLGLTRGLATAQVGGALLAAGLAARSGAPASVVLFVLYSAAQFLCGPGIYRLLMDSVPEAERSTASAVQNACGALCQAGSAALTGYVILRDGYSVVLGANAFVALAAALLFAALSPGRRNVDQSSTSKELGEVREAHP